jgi:O-acetylhomoserine (thiol)-lyase
LGITVNFVDSKDPEYFRKVIDSKTRALFVGTVAAIDKVAHGRGIPLIVDNTFSTQFLTRPFEHVADIVVHSLTKRFGGHGAGIGGVVVDSGRFRWAAGKHPLYTAPDPSYHGLRWGLDLPPPMKPLVYVLRMRTVPLRNPGAFISPDIAWFVLQVRSEQGDEWVGGAHWGVGGGSGEGTQGRGGQRENGGMAPLSDRQTSVFSSVSAK